MSNFNMPTEVTTLPEDQQQAIRKVLSDVGLLTAEGEPAFDRIEAMPEQTKQNLQNNLRASGVNLDLNNLSFNWKCAAARVAEAAAVAACATVPGGQIAIAACIAAAHALANEVCK